MKIGVDLDGVIFDTEKLYRIYAELYEVVELKKNTIIDNRNDRFQTRYNWSDEETKQFVKKYHDATIKNAIMYAIMSIPPFLTVILIL